MSEITYTWSISSLERNTSDQIVFTAHYTLSATDGEYSSSTYGSVGLEAPGEDDTVIPYSDLTEEIVVGWVKDKLGGDEKISEIEKALKAQLDEQHSPSKESGTPWSTI